VITLDFPGVQVVYYDYLNHKAAKPARCRFFYWPYNPNVWPDVGSGNTPRVPCGPR
jgi:hypothetical protein